MTEAKDINKYILNSKNIEIMIIVNHRKAEKLKS